MLKINPDGGAFDRAGGLTPQCSRLVVGDVTVVDAN